MRVSIVFFLFILTLNLTGQIRSIQGRVISESLESIYNVNIFNMDTILLGSTDIDGLFYIKMSDTTKKIQLFRGNYVSGLIKLGCDCDTIEIIMIWDDTDLGDFRNLGDSTSYSRNRQRQIKQLPDLYNLAYEKKIFKSSRICFEQIFDH